MKYMNLLINIDESIHPGKISRKDIKDLYIKEVVENIQIKDSKKLKVVIDCGNGAADASLQNYFKN